jgi:Tol biopolymer transport system component
MEPGTRLGPYEIVEQLGAGGMGEVWLAEDTRLRRKVAIKVLPEAFAADPERLARFEQEARASAALNHPHIAVVHDIGHDGNVHFMVQEFLQGQTLRDQLDKGALPLDRTLNLAVEISEALASAHKVGIVHRDLKPDNIFVTEQGHAKVLDFGLAKLTEMSPVSGSASMSPTMLGTAVGQVMGTAGYMAPEQVSGSEVDERADLFAFGCVLYAMATGRQAFSGKNVHETLARILSDDPVPVGQIDGALPAELQRIVRKLLAKDVSRRYQAAGDLGADLRQLQDDIGAGVAVPAAGGSVDGTVSAAVARSSDSARSRWLLPAATAWAAAATIYLVYLSMSASQIEPTVIRFAAPADIPRDNYYDALAIAPDGSKIVYLAGGSSGDQLWVRDLESLEARPLPGTANAEYIFFSADSRSLAFAAGPALKVIDIQAGTGVDTLATIVPDGLRGGAWDADGSIVVGQAGPTVGGGGGLARLNRSTGELELLTEAEGTLGSHRFPQFLPGGAVLFTMETAANNARSDKDIAVVSLDSGETTLLGIRGTRARYVDTGHLLYMRDDLLLAQPFDVERLETTGPEVVVLRGVGGDADVGSGQFDVSRNGILVYETAVDTQTRLALVDRSGDIELLHQDFKVMRVPRLSPDGRQIAVGISEDRMEDVWLYELERGTFDRFTSVGGPGTPDWSPDGSQLSYQSNHTGRWQIFVEPADRIGAARSIDLGIAEPFDSVAWHPDGQTLAYGAPPGDIWTTTLDGAERQQVTDTEFVEGLAAFSPDGKWMAFMSQEEGREQVYVTPYPGPGRRQVVSTDGGDEPMWSHDGSELFYRNGSEMMAVSFDPAASPPLGQPRLLFSVSSPFHAWNVPNYDVTPDGRFVMLLVNQNAEPPQRVVVLNWLEELRRLASASR